MYFLTLQIYICEKVNISFFPCACDCNFTHFAQRSFSWTFFQPQLIHGDDHHVRPTNQSQQVSNLLTLSSHPIRSSSLHFTPLWEYCFVSHTSHIHCTHTWESKSFNLCPLSYIYHHHVTIAIIKAPTCDNTNPGTKNLHCPRTAPQMAPPNVKKIAKK